MSVESKRNQVKDVVARPSVVIQVKPREEEAKKRSNLAKSIAEAVKDSAERSSIHGFPSFASSNVSAIIKIVWLLLVLLSWSYFIYQISNVVGVFLSFGTVSSITVVHEAPAVFPAVDICNLNAYYRFDNKDEMTEILAENKYHVNDSNTLREYTDTANDLFKAQIEYDRLTGNDVESMGFLIQDMLISCQYQGLGCNSSDFYYYYDYYYGNCYRFNGRENVSALGLRKSAKPGWRNGLRLELYAGSQTTQQQYSYKSGFRVIVHNQSVVPFPDEDGIDVATGQQTNVAVERTFQSRLPAPYSNCIDELTESASKQNQMLIEMYKQLKSGQIAQYTQEYCIKICFHEYLIKNCGCSVLSLSFLNMTSPEDGCTSASDIICSEEKDSHFYNSEAVLECYDACPTQCNTVTYEMRTSTAAFPTQWYANMFRTYQEEFNLYKLYFDGSDNYTGPDYEMIRRTTAMVNVYYDALKYTLIQELPAFTFDTLLANIGGNLGLFTGMSILSFVELLEVLISIVIILVNFMLKK